MEAQSKLYDMTIGICDHGLVCCPHVCIGIRCTGSPDMTTNSQPSSRLTDISWHSCPHCAINMAIEGSGHSTINGLASHRVLDMVTEFCGVGRTITGSPDVTVGD